MKLKRYTNFLAEKISVTNDIVLENKRKPDTDLIYSPELVTVLNHNDANRYNSLISIFLNTSEHEKFKDVLPIPEVDDLTRCVWSDQANNEVIGDIMDVVAGVAGDTIYFKNHNIKRDFIKKYTANVKEIYAQELTGMLQENIDILFEAETLIDTEWQVPFVILDGEKEILPSSLGKLAVEVTSIISGLSGWKGGAFGITGLDDDSVIITQYDGYNLRELEEYLKWVESKWKASKTLLDTENDPLIKFDLELISDI